MSKIIRKPSKTRPESAKKASLKFAQTEEGRESYKIRGKKISEALDTKLSDKEVEKLEEVLSYGYVADDKILALHTGLLRWRICKHKTTNPEWWKEWRQKIALHLPSYIQNLSYSEFLQFRKDVETVVYSDVMKKYGFSHTTPFKRNCKKLGLQWVDKPRWTPKQSYPEKVIESLLAKLRIPYELEKSYNHQRIIADFFVPAGRVGKVIEVQGDYWHTNPRVYRDPKKYTEVQISNRLRDQQKREWYRTHKIPCLYLWELDIRQKTSKQLTEIIVNFLIAN